MIMVMSSVLWQVINSGKYNLRVYNMKYCFIILFIFLFKNFLLVVRWMFSCMSTKIEIIEKKIVIFSVSDKKGTNFVVRSITDMITVKLN